MASTLNPYAAPFVPIAYRQVEDFSAEWWQLVKSPWFCDFWLRERFDEEELERLEQHHHEDADIYDPLHLDIDSLFHSYTDAQREDEKMKGSERMELMAWGAEKWAEARTRACGGPRCSEKAPKIVSLRVSPRTIQQPR